MAQNHVSNHQTQQMEIDSKDHTLRASDIEDVQYVLNMAIKALSPAQLHSLSSLQSTGRKENKTIGITRVNKVPDTISEGKAVGN
tara:strand:- start:388 stop:642 length:255 start_codon:yes stop_codon:yes gene_type:complete